MKLRIIAFALCATCVASAADKLPLLPYPKHVEQKDGGAFAITKTTTIALAGKSAKADKVAAEMLAEELKSAADVKAHISAAAGAHSIILRRLETKDFPKLEGNDATRFKTEGYVIDVTKSRVTVSGATDAGLFYGVQTVRQLVTPTDKGAEIRAVHIEDWPTMEWRGVHDDLSRGPIPTLDYMKKEIRTLSEYKVNMYSLYMEDVFWYKKHPLASPAEGAITADDIKDLVKYAEQYHVTLLPEQQAFGHLHHVLKEEEYSPLAETPHGHVLSPANPGSYDLIKDLYSELIPLFPGPLFHIGADETFELGRGQTKALADQEGLGKVYLDHIAKVYQIVKPYNKRLMFWADIAEHYPDLLKILPKDAIAVAWDYNPSATFDNKLKSFADAGLSLVVSPGVNDWNRQVPYYTAAYTNIRNFTRDGQKYHAIGQLNTTWDDDGESLFEMNWPPLVFGAAAAWQQGESSIEDFEQAYDWAFYRNADGHPFNDAVLNLSKTHDLLRSVGINAGANDEAFWMDPFTETGTRYTTRAMPVVRDMRLAAESAIETIYKNRSKARIHADTLEALIFAGQRVDFFGLKLQFAQDLSGMYWTAYENSKSSDPAVARRVNLGGMTSINAPLEDLRDGTMRLRALYKDRWLAEAKPYWLGSVTIRFDNLGLEFQQKINQIRLIRNGYRDTHTIPEPESIGFYKPIAPPPLPQQARPATPPPGTN